MSLRKILDPRQPRRTPDPMRFRGPGRASSCVSCGGKLKLLGKAKAGQTFRCPHCGFEQIPE